MDEIEFDIILENSNQMIFISPGLNNKKAMENKAELCYKEHKPEEVRGNSQSYK